MKLKLQTIQARKLPNRLRTLRLKPKIRDGLKKASEIILKDSKSSHNYEDWTGALSHSLRFETNDLTSRFIASTPYARFQYYGTKAHGTVRAPLLHWTDRSGKHIFAKWVRGIKADHWFNKSIVAKRDQMNAIIQNELTEGIRAKI